MLSSGSGAFSLVTEQGQEVLNLPIELGTVLPGDTTIMRLDSSTDPGPGKYTAIAVLRQSDGQEIQASSTVSIGEEKVNGCSPFSETASDGTDGSDDDVLVPLAGGRDSSWPPILLIALAVVLAAILATQQLLRRRSS